MSASKPAAPLMVAASLNELIDGIVLPVRGRRPLFVLAGLGNALRSHYSLAEPVDFSARVRMVEGERHYELLPQTFRAFPNQSQVMVDLSDTCLYRLDALEHDCFRVFLVAREESLLQDFESKFAVLADEAIQLARDHRLANALEWSQTVRRADAGALQPETGVHLPEKLRWRLRKPVFRLNEDRVLYQWELCSLVDGPYERPLITCVTGKDGQVTRQADLVPIRLMFNRFAALPPKAVPPAAAPPPPPPKPAVAPLAAPATDKPLPAFRRQALAEKQRESAENQMEKIRKLFEMPD